ncbi:MAG TPA: low-specificity L-threonine aldolase [Bacteroidota bacterium]|jgi:threonine aldolase|nr:low-specificity L-threonine aldolase [Bacteroidota bacterium]
MIDLRSDTVTKPSRAMLDAMMNAEVGDDVFGEDPTVNKLQERVAEMFGKEAALFVPSGTMGNEVCIKVHTQPGDEIILEQESHIFVYETGAPVLLAGVQMNTIPGKRGVLTPEQISAAIRPKAYYLPQTKLICLENTHGRSAGSVLPLDSISAVRELAQREHIAMHLDGARLWNASVASGIQPKEYASFFDSLSVCFSKGLGAPVGSIIIGSKPFIEQARRYRKAFGGGMRQAGILAAAALYALDHHIGRLAEDHAKARYLFDELKAVQRLRIDPSEVQTNMVFIDIAQTGKSQAEVMDLLKLNGILVTPERHSSIRAVTHLDVSMEHVHEAARVIKRLFS